MTYDTGEDNWWFLSGQGVTVPSIEREFGSLYFRVRGQGDTAVILLHDFFGTHRSWDVLQMQLSRYFLAIAPDLRGHGSSPIEHGELTISSMAGDVAAILDTMEFGRAHLVGCSHGAVVALHSARIMPDRVESVVVTSVPDLNEPDVIEYGREYATSVFPRLESELDKLHGDNRVGYSRETLLSSFIESLTNVPNDHKQAVSNANEIACSALVLNGDSDPVMSAEQAVSLMRRIPGARLGILANTGHLAHQESPAAYTEAVLDHLWRVRKS